MDTPGKILVVDDEEVVLLSIRRVLKGSNYELDTVQSPQLGLAMMESRTYDVVITDLMMPGMNGLEFLQKVREIDRDVRVILITGYATMKTALQSMRLGAFDFLAKPFTKEEFNNLVHRAMAVGKLSEVEGEEQTEAVLDDDALKPGKTYTLRHHSWARIEKDASVVIGVERNFIATIGDIATVELPAVGDSVSQGSGCARITATDGRAYTLWCPLGGRVIEINQLVQRSPEQVTMQPMENWLFRIDPTSIDLELEYLLT